MEESGSASSERPTAAAAAQPQSFSQLSYAAHVADALFAVCFVLIQPAVKHCSRPHHKSSV